MSVQAQFAWDASPELNVVAYRLYKDDVLTYVVSHPTTTILVSTVVSAVWHVTAFSQTGKESRPSQKVTIPHPRPSPPDNFRLTSGGSFEASDFSASAFAPG